jgi:hypothetical protein
MADWCAALNAPHGRLFAARLDSGRPLAPLVMGGLAGQAESARHPAAFGKAKDSTSEICTSRLLRHTRPKREFRCTAAIR